MIHLDPALPEAAHVTHRDGQGPLLDRATFTAALTATDDRGSSATSQILVSAQP